MAEYGQDLWDPSEFSGDTAPAGDSGGGGDWVGGLFGLLQPIANGAGTGLGKGLPFAFSGYTPPPVFASPGGGYPIWTTPTAQRRPAQSYTNAAYQAAPIPRTYLYIGLALVVLMALEH